MFTACVSDQQGAYAGVKSGSVSEALVADVFPLCSLRRKSLESLTLAFLYSFRRGRSLSITVSTTVDCGRNVSAATNRETR